MIVQNIYDTVANMKEQLQVELNHPYVKQFIHHPIIDENKLLCICSFLNGISIEEREMPQYTLPIMLVQIALDTHDLVSIQPVGNNESILKERQLTVLAGDYYSGLYYYYFSKSGQLELIKEVASAIKDINVSKIKLYQSHTTDVDDMMLNFRTVETALVQCLCNYFKQEEWKELLQQVLFISSLLNELRRHEEGKPSFLIEALQNKGNVHDIVMSQVKESTIVIERYLQSQLVLNDQLTDYLYKLLNKHKHCKNVVGEG
ncbi:heptaprenyl diphosphate synthase component 1 [Metabacillus iocasae]|uniref:Heptaprenyl diphosphate synthase n=1 Tax=Priestia iocasae TaxID=2291674 RepID=A0ABS2QR77_9BACI|nr:heptaprenyl diphosphate synthase component 1 [Metabacillus iocasae]MBM7701718.1 heptaprenyl diphosphate synthase [Metabacillus iocasae]